jgi:ribonuclease T1
MFKNLAGKLPVQELGSSKEYTVPTPDVIFRRSKRLVIGQNGKMYYTQNRYQTFEEII